MVLSYSCADDFVENDVNPVLNIPISELIVDFNSAQAALIGVYNDAQNNSMFLGDGVYLTGLYSDELDHTGSFPTFAQFEGNDVSTDNLDNTQIWGGTYDLIFDANFVIQGVNAISDQLDEVQVNSLIGQATTLRGVAYLNLARLYGGVPIYTDIDADQGINAGNFEGKERSTIQEVYNQALNDFNFAVNALQGVDDGFFIGEMSARFFRAKLNTEIGDYNAALQDLQAIEGNFSLLSSYDNVFNNGINSESIFKLDFSDVDGNGLAFFFYPASDGGRREVAASNKLIEALQLDPLDSRSNLLATIGNTDNVINKYTDTGNGADQFNIIRYADVLLYLAEVQSRLGQFSQASVNLNLVRARAGVNPITLDQNNFIDVIANERFIELFAEGHRWYDIKRLGLADQIIQDKPNAVFIPSRNNLLPIPSDELDTNPNISQDNQNPGY